MTSMAPSQCRACSRLDRSTTAPGIGTVIPVRCDAFPEQIPQEITALGADHREFFGGEVDGLLFEQDDTDDAREAYRWWGNVFGATTATRSDAMDPETRDRVLALLPSLDDECRGMDDNQLKRYWTVGEGLKRWRFSPHPWTKLRNLLRKHVGPGRAERMASEWFHVVFGYWPGHRKGSNPVGPG